MDCNKRDEEQKPWCLQRANPADRVPYQHDPLDTMILVTGGVKSSQDTGTQTTDQRLESLEAKSAKILDQVADMREAGVQRAAFEGSVSARLDRLEAMLTGLITALNESRRS